MASAGTLSPAGAGTDEFKERAREMLKCNQAILLKQLETAQIVLGPPGISDHILEGAGAEGLSRTMEDNGHGSTVGMAIRLVAALLTHEDKPVAQQSAYEFSRRDIARQRHTLTATVGAVLTSTSPAGSVGMGSPAWRRAST
jgi:hypothetical protein